MKTLVIHFARLGPYHLARLGSAVEVLGPLGWRVVALEVAGGDATYEWERTREGVGAGFERRTVFPDGVYERIGAGEMMRGVVGALEEVGPDAVAVAGWGTVDARVCLGWCRRAGVRVFVMSETRAVDGRRVWWREWVKSRIVRRFDGGLCGGESHRRYLVELGVPRGRVELGYNVVDNDFFAGAKKSGRQDDGRQDDGERRGAPEDRRSDVGNQMSEDGGLMAEGAKLVPSSATGKALDASSPATGHSQPAIAPQVLPRPYFLASNRFIERKNLGRLIEAYHLYSTLIKGEIWPLALLGDGELRGELEGLCGELGLRIADGEGRTADGSKLVPSSATGDELDSERSTLDLAARGTVIFAGFRQIGELRDFYEGAGAFVHPALDEPWGLVINEAMASGLPVISSRNVGAAEELVVDGVTGFCFDPEDVEELAGLMGRVAGMGEGERAAMGGAAREMVERKVPRRAFGEGLARLLGESA